MTPEERHDAITALRLDMTVPEVHARRAAALEHRRLAKAHYDKECAGPVMSPDEVVDRLATLSDNDVGCWFPGDPVVMEFGSSIGIASMPDQLIEQLIDEAMPTPGIEFRKTVSQCRLCRGYRVDGVMFRHAPECVVLQARRMRADSALMS